MSLRRLTLSGQFAQNEGKVEESTTIVIAKGLLAIAVDVGIALAVAFFALNMFIGKLFEPYERGFYCYEVPYINNPFRPNTISTKHLLAVSIASPFLVIVLVEAVVFMISKGENKLRKYFHFTTSIYLIYLASFVISAFIMEVLKCTFARLRPHYLSVCQPNWEQINCNDPNTYIENANCLGTNMHRIRVGRQSFPSGHTSAAVLFFLFLYFYLKGIVNATRSKLLRIIRFMVLLISGAWTVLVMTTRVTDNWHYPTDVLGGIILALSCAYIFVPKTHSSLVYQNRLLQNEACVVGYMACFDSEELTDFIRHQCIINADDDSRCKKILKPPSRKAKPGGLPLNFRPEDDSDTSSGEYSPCYLASANCESTYELIEERLRSRIQKNDLLGLDDEDEAVKNNPVDAQPSTSNLEFFQCSDVSRIPLSFPVKKSVTALLLEKTDFLISSDLASYARFAAPDIENGRKLLVFYPFVELESSSGKCFSLTIYAQCDICISDLIGLCCYEYARCRKTNNIGSATHYHLLMAEKNGEVDRDLPPIDGNRLLNELGSCWSTIALEKKRNLNCSEMTNVIVYTVSGKQYEFLMDSLDVPLRWLRDQAVKKRIEDEGSEFLSDCPALREYVLEAAKQPDVVLDLNKPISSTACLEFLLLRINSSRGNFILPRFSNFAQRDGTTPKVHGDLQSSSFKRRQCSAIRTDGFELAPSHLDGIGKRNSVFLNRSLKTLYVTWDYVGGVEFTDRSNLKRGVKIIWLVYRPIKHKSEVLKMNELASRSCDSTLTFESDRSTENNELSRRKLYNDARWKILKLEADVDDAWNITKRINTIIDDVNSVVRQIYKYSNGGSKKPKKAAAEAFGSDTGAQFRAQNSPINPPVRRVSRMTSAVTGIVPVLLRLLWKHNCD
ncbi:unnamed protein product [Cercopithifilaria johnstoni]|uniref:Phosphatidic acid phosphatase type 2/haloperoxidase domain-containing protein n=1 Tax=Cercopithifilaria johnstoni TaxID=2874296 RepID=A0A8J2LZJ7_9BILA|nr:unnamed protein product [Cercopithifilaria johnstoni]